MHREKHPQFSPILFSYLTEQESLQTGAIDVKRVFSTNSVGNIFRSNQYSAS
jgi:hypothetical protein